MSETPLTEVMEALEAQRRRAIVSYVCTVFGLIVAIPLLAAPFLTMVFIEADASADSPWRAELRTWLTPHLETLGLIGAGTLLVGLLGGLWAFRRFAWLPKLRYLGDYKQQVFMAACRDHFPGLTYVPHGGLPYAFFDNSGLYPYISDEYSSEDRFEGRAGATDVCFAEATAKRVVRRGLPGNRETVHETYFRGIVFCADFHKHFRSVTRLVPKGAAHRSRSGENPVTLESPEFAAAFDVFSTDQTDVRYVLSPSLMERLTELNRRFRGLRALFADEWLLLLLPTSRDRFEPSLHVPADSADQIEAFVADVRACLAVVDALDLNTRIWSKS